jgi:hypothetical protein
MTTCTHTHALYLLPLQMVSGEPPAPRAMISSVDGEQRVMFRNNKVRWRGGTESSRDTQRWQGERLCSRPYAPTRHAP